MKKQIIRRLMIPNLGPFVRLPEQPVQPVRRQLSQPKGITMARNGITKTVRISQAGIARIGKVRRMAGTPVSSDPMALNVVKVKEWINLLLTNSGRDDLLLPESVMDANSFTHRMDAIVQSIQSSIDEERSNSTSEESASVLLSNRTRGKQRQLGKRALSHSEVRERALRSMGIVRS